MYTILCPPDTTNVVPDHDTPNSTPTTSPHSYIEPILWKVDMSSLSQARFSASDAIKLKFHHLLIAGNTFRKGKLALLDTSLGNLFVKTKFTLSRSLILNFGLEISSLSAENRHNLVKSLSLTWYHNKINSLGHKLWLPTNLSGIFKHW